MGWGPQGALLERHLRKRGDGVLSQERMGMEGVQATGGRQAGPHNPSDPGTERLCWKHEENEACAPGQNDLQGTSLPRRMFIFDVAKNLGMDDNWTQQTPHSQADIHKGAPSESPTEKPSEQAHRGPGHT